MSFRIFYKDVWSTGDLNTAVRQLVWLRLEWWGGGKNVF